MVSFTKLCDAGVAQLVERDPSKFDVVGSRPSIRSNMKSPTAKASL
jgi:hypothetical protein